MPQILKINPLTPDEKLLRQAADIVIGGGIIIYPTETVYGIGALFSNEQALKRVFTVKGRDESKPILLLIQNITALRNLTTGMAYTALELAEKYWPGPLTLLFEASDKLSPFLIGNEKKIGCRISSSPVARKLLSYIKQPITSTSANLSGEPPPSEINAISPVLLDSVDVVLDAGKLGDGPPSTVIDVTQEPYKIVRKGAVLPNDI